MKLQFAAMITVVSAIAVVVCWPTSQQAAADDAAVFTATHLALSNVALEDEHAFVTSRKCKKCHIKVFKSWEKGPHGESVFEILKPGERAEAKSKHGLDPNKDYTKDASCLECHTTGFGHEGGYAVPAEGDKKAEKEASRLAHVGCESCHGAGEAYLEVFEDIQKSKRQYEQSELYAKGLNKMGQDVCMTCHNDKSPTFDASKEFVFEEMVKKGTHEHEELELRK